ncbi:TPA: hypothetical protein EYP12_08915 [Candidatus Bipolaricaulota bacterium]|nr:hypothetical protein [Candidatus Bipolaricaulota bacterium]
MRGERKRDPAPKVRDKHLKLDQEKLDQARKILGAKTEREAVEQALDLIISEEEIDRLLKELEGKGTIKKVFV